LDRLRELGLSEPLIGGQRDGWILVAAQFPEQMPLYMKLKQQELDDPITVEFYRDLAAMIEWEADDARVTALCDRLVGLLDAAEAAGVDTFDAGMTDELAELLDSVFLNSVPAAPRLLKQMEERGWRGWTKLERIGPR
jgi:hypothetical protein